MIEGRFRVLFASFVITLAAMLGGGTVALRCILMFPRGDSVRFNYVVIFVH